jgi:uncharacterized protein YecE (DUF72 family)
VTTAVVGTAGWSLPRAEQPRFPGDGTHLERYARVLAGAEINASFYRPLRPALYAKWAAGVPAHFRFAVKVPKAITHEHRLLEADEPLVAFLDQVAGLEEKLGCLLVQLPPSLRFEPSVAGAFLALLRALHDGPVALEPRHVTWFTPDAEGLLTDYEVARVAADPALVPEAATPGGASSLVYHRLHGSPRMYWSHYDEAYLDALAARIAADARTARAVWCIFDNTAGGAALPNALELVWRLGDGSTTG